MQIINDYYMMTVTQRYESSISPSGIITLNTAWVHDENIDRFNYKRNYGRIEAIPMRFNKTVIEIMDPGYPQPRLHVSGEQVERQFNSGKKQYAKHKQKFYNCSGLDKYQVRTVADIAKRCSIKKFDTIYFDPRVTEPENMIGTYQGREMYKIPPQDIICVVRDKKIITQGMWCLVEPDMETWEDITTKAGIIKKPRPEAIAMRGIMRHFHGRDDVKEGDNIIYQKGADWLMKIEGKEYYAIEHDDILCKVIE